MLNQKRTELLTQILIAFVSVVVTSAVIIFTFQKQYNADEKHRLSENLNKILDVELQYPYFEDSSFIARSRKLSTDSALRYSTYCEYLFNFCQDVCKYYDYDSASISALVDITDLVIQHKEYWISPDSQKSGSYPQRLRQFIDNIYKEN